MTIFPVPPSVPWLSMRARLVTTPGLSEPYQDRICFTRSLAAIVASPRRRARAALPDRPGIVERPRGQTLRLLLDQQRPGALGLPGDADQHLVLAAGPERGGIPVDRVLHLVGGGAVKDQLALGGHRGV